MKSTRYMLEAQAESSNIQDGLILANGHGKLQTQITTREALICLTSQVQASSG